MCFGFGLAYGTCVLKESVIPNLETLLYDKLQDTKSLRLAAVCKKNPVLVCNTNDPLFNSFCA